MTSRVELLLFAGLYAVAVAMLFFFVADWTGRQTWVVILTGVVVIWYTSETKRLRETSARQLEIQIRPFVLLRPADGGGFLLENVGPGVALNVRVRDVVVDAEHGVKITFRESVPVLRSRETLRIRAETFRGDRSAGDFFSAHIDPRYANRELAMMIEYQNVDLKTYAVVQKTQPAAMAISGFEAPRAV